MANFPAIYLLYREIKNNQDQIDMQRDLDALMDWVLVLVLVLVQ